MIVGSFPNVSVRELGRAIPADIAPKNDAAAAAGSSSATGATKGAGFTNFLERAVGEVDGKLKAADAEKSQVLTGETTNLHQAVIAMQEAGVAFSLMIEVRNKLVESYQELMRVQV